MLLAPAAPVGSAVAPTVGARVDLHAWEPADAEYWGAAAADPNGVAGPPYPVPEFAADALGRDVFDAHVRAGRPLVVRGVGASHPMRGWDCAFFQADELFRHVELKREYAGASAKGPAWLRAAALQTLRGESAEGPCVPGEHSSPYYLGIKDAGPVEELAEDPFASTTWTVEVLGRVQNHTVVPEFMDPANEEYLRRTPEFWFAFGGCSGGAKAHVDQHTESTMSLQLSGRKRWRVAPIAPRAAQHVMKLYQDGQIYGRDEQRTWNILADVVLEPGDAIVFPPGFIHQTDAVGSTCAASVTWQFNQPAPTTFWRHFLPRLRRTPDMVHTWDLLRALVRGGKKSRPSDRIDLAAQEAFFDASGDGTASEAEKEQVLAAWRQLEAEAKSQVPKVLLQQRLGVTKVLEDADEIRRLPPEVRAPASWWEEEALRLDAMLAGASLSGGSAAAAGTARHAVMAAEL